MKIIMIFDQIQSGLGTKDDKMLPLGGKKEPIGPAVMMAPFLKEVDGHVIACLYCGNGTYLANPDEVTRKLCAMVDKIKPDVVICGPAFNYIDYARMCAHVAYEINTSTDIKAFAAMSEENEETIELYKDKISIVKTPKKGGFGLNDSLRNMCKLAQVIVKGEDTKDLESKICYK
ncbi:GrdB-related putative oxidoreductase [Clostridium sartagoforme]|jgi:glycine/betaine/sarcosine/D-proline reductase family selenoprotein B|uniref:GrdB-related putative oxidoreductase n=1 Tax=Clostridium sartagoforme TaxID=84031 RepID=UPI0031E122EC